MDKFYKFSLLLFYLACFAIVLFATSFSFAMGDYKNGLLIITSLSIFFLGRYLKKRHNK